MKYSQMLCVLVLWLFSTSLHAFGLESILEKENSRTPEQMVREIELLPDAKKLAVYQEIGNISGISGKDARHRFLSGDFTTRPCGENEILNTAGYDPADGALKYAPRFCRNETLVLFDDMVVASAGCGNPSDGQYRKVEMLVTIHDPDPEEDAPLEKCHFEITGYVATHQTIETSDYYYSPWVGNDWGNNFYHLGSNGGNVDVPIIFGVGDKLVCREVPSQQK